MKALTLHQPWASLVALGVKTIETRSWSTTYRGPLVIHAGQRPTKSLFIGDHIVTASGRLTPRKTGHGTLPLPLGAVVATCTLVDVVPIVANHTDRQLDDSFVVDHKGKLMAFHGCEGAKWPYGNPGWGGGIGGYAWPIEDQRPYGDYAPGRFAWLLADVVALDEPIPARGRQGLWNWDAGEAA